ncbi:MAG: hypothetical protein Solivirus1_70 [Solivirus sp.]|uniref:Uncharacterized protein n=1 Tax=Solivirus sp. TaxID=2487772 RepID=A0A3G5AJC0_9VIRU|nr:MAG: hypothetical protein Solivirus1_70 [Solivirus sp.]
MSTFYKLSETKAENFFAPNKPNKRNWKNEKDGSSGSFQALDIRYKSPETGIIGDAFFELMGEGTLRKDQFGKVTLTIRIKEEADKIGAQEANKGVMACIAKHKQDLNMNHFEADRPGDVRGVYFYDAANSTSPVDGVEPKIYLRLDSSSSFQIPVKKDGKVIGQKIPYQSLIDKKMTGSVIFSPRDVYRANGAITRCYVRCFTILSEPTDAGYIDVFGNSENSKQSDTIAKFLEQAKSDPALLTALLASAEKLKSESKSLLIAAPATTTTTTTIISNGSQGNGANSANMSAPAPSLGIPTMSSMSSSSQMPQQFQQQAPQNQIAYQPQQMPQQMQQFQQQAPQQYQTVPPTPSSVGASQMPTLSQFNQQGQQQQNQALANFFAGQPGQMAPMRI